MLLIRRGSATPQVLSKNQNQVTVTVGLKAIGGDKQARLSYSTSSPSVTISANSKTETIREAAGTTPVPQIVTLTKTSPGAYFVTIDVAVEGALPASIGVSLFWE